MADRIRIRIIPHPPECIPDCGSFEVWFADGRASQFFYWDDNPGRASITRKMDQNQAREAARALARAERDKLEHVCLTCEGSGYPDRLDLLNLPKMHSVGPVGGP